MKKIINIIIFTLITFSFVGCFDNEARLGGFPYFNAEGVESVHRVSHLAQILEIPFGSNRELNIAISTDEYTNNNDSKNNPSSDLNAWIHGSWDSNSSRILLEIKDNYSDYERTVTITISTNSSSEVIQIKITQEGIKYSTEEIFHGNAVLSTQEDVNDFVAKGYKEITGNLIIGKAPSIKAQNTNDIPVEIDGTTYYFTKNTQIQYLDQLNSIKRISGGIYAIGLNIQDLHFLSEIVGIETLVAIYNPRLENISGLIRLINLKTLHLNNNNISDISSLNHLVNLETLYLGSGRDETNSIANISPLYTLTNLNELHLNYLPISLYQINKLKSNLPIQISVEGVIGANPAQIYQGDIFLRTQQDVNSFISNGYTEVNGDMIIGNTTSTEPTSYLTTIWVNGYSHYVTRNSSITDLSSLKITHVQGSVYLAGFLDITDLSIISPLLRVRRLHILASTILTDISTLSNFSNLENLFLKINEVTDISPLSNCTKLTQLFLENMEVSDLTPLYPLKRLSYINLSNLPITVDNINALKKELPDCTINYWEINN